MLETQNFGGFTPPLFWPFFWVLFSWLKRMLALLNRVLKWVGPLLGPGEIWPEPAGGEDPQLPSKPWLSPDLPLHDIEASGYQNDR